MTDPKRIPEKCDGSMAAAIPPERALAYQVVEQALYAFDDEPLNVSRDPWDLPNASLFLTVAEFSALCAARMQSEKPVEHFFIDRDPLDGSPIPRQPRRFGKQIIKEVAKETGISVADILGPRRLAPIAAARRIAMQRIRTELGYSYPQIGRMFDRDHSTCIWACRGGRAKQPYRSPEQRNAA